MLIGEFLHNIDKKGRVFVPAKLREDLGERFVVSRGLDGAHCLAIYAPAEWEKLKERIAGLSYVNAKKLQRFLFSGATELESDAQGRVLLPQNLREYAGLEDSAYIIGASDRVEIWSRAEWEKQREEMTSENIAELMQSIDF